MLSACQSKWIGRLLLGVYTLVFCAGQALHALPGIGHHHPGVGCSGHSSIALHGSCGSVGASTEDSSHACCEHDALSHVGLPVEGSGDEGPVAPSHSGQWEDGSDHGHECSLCRLLAVAQNILPRFSAGCSELIEQSLIVPHIQSNDAEAIASFLPRGPPPSIS